MCGISAERRARVFRGREDPDRAGWVAQQYSISELCRREKTAENLSCNWSKEFLEAGRGRVAKEGVWGLLLSGLISLICINNWEIDAFYPAQRTGAGQMAFSG